MLAPILAFAGVAAVQAGPLYQRQVSSAVSSAAGSAISSAVGAPSSIASDVSSAVASATSSASSAVESATSAASSGVASASSAVSSASSSGASAAISAASSNTTTGNQSYPLYPCPTGYLLTYVQVNQTVPVPVTQVTQQFGEWANSSYFPNVTASEGGNNVGATHTINLQGVDLIETLVNATMFNNSGAARWEWNLTNGPASAMGVSISNYSTVLSIYDPTFESTNTIGNETTLLTYTNFCASSQAEGMTLVSALANLELGSFAGRLGGSAAGGMSSMSMSMDMTSSMASSAASSAMMATSSVASSAMMATSSIASSAAEATSSAASAAASGASAASSGAAGATSTVAGAVSSAITAVLPSSSA